MEICGYDCTDHVIEMMEERDITEEQVEEMIRHGISKKNKYDGKFEINYDGHKLVFDPKTKTLVTVFFEIKPLRGNERKETKNEEPRNGVPYKRERYIWKPELEEHGMKNGLQDLFNFNKGNNRMKSLVVLKKTESQIIYSTTLQHWLEGFLKETFLKNKLNRYGTRGSSSNKVKNLFSPSNLMVEALGTFVARDVSTRSFIDIGGSEKHDVRGAELVLLDGHTRTTRLLDLYKKDLLSEEHLSYEITVVAHICSDTKAEKLFRRINTGSNVSRADNSLSPGAPLGKQIKMFKWIPNKGRELKQINFLEGISNMFSEEPDVAITPSPGALYEQTIVEGKKFNETQKREANEYELELTEENREFIGSVQEKTNDMLDNCLFYVEEESPSFKKLIVDSIKNAGFQKLVQCYFATSRTSITADTVSRRFVTNMTKSIRKHIGQLNNQTKLNRQNAFNKVITSLEKN